MRRGWDDLVGMQILVVRQPFKVYAWVDRGYYGVGDTVKASFSGADAGQQAGDGEGRLEDTAGHV